MEIRRRRSRRSPRRIEARLLGPFDTIEIDAPDFGGVEAHGQACHWQGQLCLPELALFVDTRAPVQAAPQILFLAWPNVQINPKAVGAHFEFFVAARIRSARLQKNLGDVAIPQLVSPPLRLCVAKNCDAAVAREESQIQSFPRPQQTDLRFSLRVVVLALPVLTEANCRSASPRPIGGKSLHIGTPGELRSDDRPDFAIR